MKISGNGTQQALLDLLKARYSLIYAVSAEETRVEAAIAAAAKARQADVSRWGISRGFIDAEDNVEMDVEDPIGALRHILETPATQRRVWILRDFHAFLDDAPVRRWLRDLAITLRQRPQQAIVILAPVLKLPADLEKDVAVLDWPLLSRDQLGELVDGLLVEAKLPEKRNPFAQSREAIVEAALGLTASEAENVLARSLVTKGSLDVGVVLDAKREAVRKSGVLEFTPAPKDGLASVGGLENLKPWLIRRRRAFTAEAREAGIDAPKGMLLLGPPGTGKSRTAGAVAAAWGMGLIRLDVGRLMGSLVGESEANWRTAQKVIESVAPCVLWVDEIEKALAGAGSDSSGVTTRLVGSLLTWMATQDKGVFVVATANDVSALPPELLRKGRFDEIWFVDLPTASEREVILAIHLAKRKADPTQINLTEVAGATADFSGAELEQVVVDAKHKVFDEGVALSTAHLVSSARETYPLARTMGERIKALREWAKTRARAASAAQDKPTANSRFVDLSEGN